MTDPTGPAMKRCCRCREVKPLDQFHRDRARRDGLQGRCKACSTVIAKARYAANPEATAEYNRRRYWADPEKAREEVRQVGVELKATVFSHYGTACACCGGADDLTIDHINGDGREYREATFGHNDVGGTNFYRWIVANGFPDDLQTLCRPCNRSKGPGERCRIDHRDPSELAEEDKRPCGHSWAEVRSDGRGCAACFREYLRQLRAAKNDTR